MERSRVAEVACEESGAGGCKVEAGGRGWVADQGVDALVGGQEGAGDGAALGAGAAGYKEGLGVDHVWGWDWGVWRLGTAGSGGDRFLR